MSPVAEKIIACYPGFDQKRIAKAIALIGGDDLICQEHLNIMLSLRPDETTLLVYLLHEHVLEGHMTLKKAEETFGREVAQMVSNLNAVSTLPVSKSAQPDVLHKLFLTLAKDLRTVMVLLVNKLAELQHFYASKHPRLKEVCRNAMDIYVPIATRLGVYEIKTLMEDVCFEVLYPQEYEEVMDQLKQYMTLSDPYIKKGTQALHELLDNCGIPIVEISGRMKHPYSIYSKMRRKQKSSVHDIFDLFAFRIIVKDGLNSLGEEDISSCYAVLGLIHSKWKPIARRFKDYIAVAKVNGYRSLHTTILGLTPDVRDEPAEVQIRTETMHKEAEFGIAAHWWYKDDSHELAGKVKNGHAGEGSTASLRSAVEDKRVKNQLQWLRGLADLHEALEQSENLSEESRLGESDSGRAPSPELQLFTDQIFVLTPHGDVKDLPVGSTPVDFAYVVHTQVGNACVQAKVNGVIVPLDCELRNGDVVQIVTKQGGTPNRYWLSFVKTHAAQYRIKNWFRQQDRENNLKTGRELLNRELTRLNKPQLDPSLSFLESFEGRSLLFKEREFILESIGNGHFSTKHVLKKILPEDELLSEKNIAPVKLVRFREDEVDKTREPRVVISGESDIPISFASCCAQNFGEPIKGYVGRGNSVKIHALSCDELSHLEQARLIEVNWEGTEGYFITLEIKTDDSPEVSSVIWDRLKLFVTPIKELSTVGKVSDGVIRRLSMKVKDLDELQDVMTRIGNAKGVYDVRKIS